MTAGLTLAVRGAWSSALLARRTGWRDAATTLEDVTPTLVAPCPQGGWRIAAARGPQ